MIEHENTPNDKSIQGIRQNVDAASKMLVDEQENSVVGDLVAAHTHIIRAREAIAGVLAGSTSTELEDAHAATELVTEQLESTIVGVTTAAGELAIYRSSLVGADTEMKDTRSRPAGQSQQQGSHRSRRDRRRTNADTNDNDSSSPIKVSIIELHSRMRYTQHELLSQLPYSGIAMETRKAILRGNESAFYVPAVQFIIDTTLSILDQPSVTARMPKELNARAIAAMDCVYKVVEVAVNAKMIDQFYSNNVYLSPYVSPILRQSLNDQAYLKTLSSSVFSDAKSIVGGAVRALRQKGGAVDERGIITRSSSLKAIAGVDKRSIEELTYRLGIPYVETSHYIIGMKDGTPVDVAFSDETTAYIRQHTGPGVGCPVRQMKAQEEPYSTEFDYGWERIVQFLICPGVTVDAKQARILYRSTDGITGK
jgi:hypothetical protein